MNPVAAMLKHLEATIKPIDAPIPVVAASSVDTTKLVDAFDLGIVPPELLSDETNEQAREEKGTVGLLLTLSHFETVQRGLQCCSYRRLGGRGLAVIGTIMALLILALEHVLDTRIRTRKNN